jgi:hypothetical protein
MSQKQELAIRGLLERVTSLEARMAALEGGGIEPGQIEAGPIAKGPYKATHKHAGLWIIQDGDGSVCEMYGAMKKRDAQRIADELNGPHH